MSDTRLVGHESAVKKSRSRLLLQDAIQLVEDYYRGRGLFHDQLGFGRLPVMVVVDFMTLDEVRDYLSNPDARGAATLAKCAPPIASDC
jgi:hypothetical protein